MLIILSSDSNSDMFMLCPSHINYWGMWGTYSLHKDKNEVQRMLEHTYTYPLYTVCMYDSHYQKMQALNFDRVFKYKSPSK